MKSVAQLTREIRNQIWASGEPENLVTAHDFHFQEALGLIQQYVLGQQSDNINVVAFCKTQYKCGTTLLAQPPGTIRRLYTIANGQFCDPVFYRQVEVKQVECFGRQLLAYVGTFPSPGKALAIGITEADAANDSKCGRARQGIWAIWKGNIYVAPWIQSMESVVIEWDGVKTEWGQDDPVSEEIQFRNCVKLYAQFCHERDYGDPARAALFHNPNGLRYQGVMAPTGHFDLALAELIWSDRERRKVHPHEWCFPDPDIQIQPTITETGIPPDPPGELLVVHTGFLEGDDAAVATARANVTHYAPSAIFAAGLLRDSTAGYDDTVGLGFFDYIFPYAGVHGTAADKNKFWPAPGKLDWDKDDLVSFKDFFTNRTTNYYETCLNLAGGVHVHFFVLSSDSREPDGIDVNSKQAEWLKIKLRLSTADWKIVVLADNPYSSVRQVVDLRWTFEEWGADLVLSSGAVNYERLNVSGFPYIVNGLAGGVMVEPVTPSLETIQSYSGGPGVGVITADTATLRYDFYLPDGTLFDELKLTK